MCNKPGVRSSRCFFAPHTLYKGMYVCVCPMSFGTSAAPHSIELNGPPENLDDLREALEIVSTWTSPPHVNLRVDHATKLLFESDKAQLAVEVRVAADRRHCDLIVSLRTRSTTTMCAVAVENMKKRFEQVARLVHALKRETVYKVFFEEYQHEQRFVYSEFGMGEANVPVTRCHFNVQ